MKTRSIRSIILIGYTQVWRMDTDVQNHEMHIRRLQTTASRGKKKYHSVSWLCRTWAKLTVRTCSQVRVYTTGSSVDKLVAPVEMIGAIYVSNAWCISIASPLANVGWKCTTAKWCTKVRGMYYADQQEAQLSQRDRATQSMRVEILSNAGFTAIRTITFKRLQ